VLFHHTWWLLHVFDYAKGFCLLCLSAWICKDIGAIEVSSLLLWQSIISSWYELVTPSSLTASLPPCLPTSTPQPRHLSQYVTEHPNTPRVQLTFFFWQSLLLSNRWHDGWSTEWYTWLVTEAVHVGWHTAGLDRTGVTTVQCPVGCGQELGPHTTRHLLFLGQSARHLRSKQSLHLSLPS